MKGREGLTLVLATGNRGKMREFARLLSGLPLRVMTRDDFRDWPPLPEEGETFEENALSKALNLASWAGLPALADDSGLEVEALGGAPGVRSSRYAGEEGDDARNIALLLEELKGVPRERRGARFVCVLALAGPGGETFLVRETCEGSIAEGPRGEGGFGYDPVFIPRGCTLTFAELPLSEKNRISHRGKALRALRSCLEAGEPRWFFES